MTDQSRNRSPPAQGRSGHRPVGIALVVDHGAYQDVLLLASGDAASVSAGGVSTDGTFAMVRRSRSGRVNRAAIVQGRRLDAGGLPVLRLDAAGTAVSAERTVRISQ